METAIALLASLGVLCGRAPAAGAPAKAVTTHRAALAPAGNFSAGADTALQFGVREIVLTGNGAVANPFDSIATMNFVTSHGEMRVRVSDKGWHAFDGFNYADCVPFTGNSIAHRVEWKGRSLDDLKGQELRLEFNFSKDANLYAFRAEGPQPR